MKTHSRTPQQRDRRFARVRRLTRTVFIGSGVASTVMVGFIASRAAPTVSIAPKATTTTTVPPASTTTTDPSGATTTVPKSTTTTIYTPPTTVPVTTTTVCYTKPSGGTTCS